MIIQKKSCYEIINIYTKKTCFWGIEHKLQMMMSKTHLM